MIPLILALSTSFLAPLGTFPSSHGSTLVELAGGDLMACWFAGTREAGRDVRIVCSRRGGDGAWSSPRTAVEPGERTGASGLRNKFVGNPSLLRDDEGYLWLFYEAVKLGGHSGAYIDYKVSRDEGRTWSLSRRLAGGFADFGHLPRNRALRLSPGRYLLPVYREFLSKYGYVFDLRLAGGRILSKKALRIPGTEHIQPALVRLASDRVVALLRNTRGKRVLSSTLTLSTLTWSPVAETNLPNPDAAVDAVLTGDGRVLLAYNHSETGRTPLSLALSEDGVTFRRVADLETGPGGFAYPSLLRASDGRYHVTYTYDRKAIKTVSFDDRSLASGAVSP